MTAQVGKVRSLAAEITKESSKQTYYTIRLFADRDRVEDAFRAYGYFRWVDDILDSSTGSKEEKTAFIKRQRNLLESIYRGEHPNDLCTVEQMLFDLIQNDTDSHPGLRSYLNNMMAVMEFDVERRGRYISTDELDRYSHWLAVAVTDALFYFIGHDDPAPNHPDRYHAVTAAHITHMLRDTHEDIQAGYYNIPSENLPQNKVNQGEKENLACRDWVCHRVKLARSYFKTGRKYISRVKNFRCRLAGYAYAARFEWVMRAIERDNYCLRQDYSQRKSFGAALRMGWSTLISMLSSALTSFPVNQIAKQTVRIEE